MKHSSRKAPALIAGVLGFILLAASLSSAYGATVFPGQPPTVAAQATPSVQITKPKDGEVIKGTMVTVNVRSENFRVMAPKAQNVPGEGHLHFRLNDGPPLEALSDSYVFTQIEAASHKLEVELTNHDHSALNPPVTAMVRFRTARPSMLDFSQPWPWILGVSILAAGFLMFGLIRARR